MIRTATPADAALVAALAERTFREAFSAQNPPPPTRWTATAVSNSARRGSSWGC